MEPLHVYQARWRFILLALLLLPFAAGSLLLLAADEWEQRLMGLGGLVLFGSLTLFGLVQALRSRPVLLLSDAGIEDTRLKIGVIPWNEVERAYELPYFWHKNVQVLVRHPEQFRQRQPWLTRTLGELNAMSGWSPFVLVTSNTDTPAKTVVDYIYQQLLHQWPTPAPDPEPAAPTEPGEY